MRPLACLCACVSLVAERNTSRPLSSPRSWVKRAAKLWQVLVGLMSVVAVAGLMTRLLPNDQTQPIEQDHSLGIDPNATDGSFTPDSNGVYHRSCFRVACWPYLERNAELDYDAIIYFSGTHYFENVLIETNY